MKSADPKPPNLFFSDNSYFYKAATWWDIGECGTMLVFYYRDNHPADIEFNIYSLITSPYSTLQKPYAELHKKGTTTEHTLDINDADVDMHGWVTFEGEITFNQRNISTNWRDIEKFTTEFKAIVKRTIYEAIEINSQIAEESNTDEIDFDKENPYLESKKENDIKNSSNINKNADKDNSSPWGCLILIILILIAWMTFK
jgi:hypothetical protein